MRLLFVADGRSPIALNWIRHFVEIDHEVHLVSTYPCQPRSSLASLHVIPVAFSSAATEVVKANGDSQDHFLRRVLPIRLRTAIRQWLGPLTLPGAARQLREVIAKIQPQMIHAMRIPYEGMLTTLADPSQPLLVSIWGNDFTLHAPATPLMANYTKLTLRRVNAIHADCHRDVRMAMAWGYDQSKPAVVLPGGGGVQLNSFYPPSIKDGYEEERSPFVINPRGMRAYVRNDTFFRSIPFVLEQFPKARFICVNMAQEPEAIRWIKELDISTSVNLLPKQTRSEMADLYRKAPVAVSITTHDGTPNTLLESLACGCFPVVGDIESLREWVTHGVNGFLVDPEDHQALARSIITALEMPGLRSNAREINLGLIAERADHNKVMQAASAFYQQLIG
jgi:glycosyltransferase involved in cell wall biosynthesis